MKEETKHPDQNPEFNKEVVLEKSIALFTPAESLLNDFKDLYGEMPVVEITDKEGIKGLKSGHKVVKEKRIEYGKVLREFISTMEDIKKTVKLKAVKTVDGFKAIEINLKNEIDRIKDEIEKSKKTEEYKQLAVFNERVDELNEIGFEFDGANYLLGSIVLDPVEISGATPDLWGEVIETCIEESKRLEKLKEAKRLEELQAIEDEKEEPAPQPEIIDHAQPGAASNDGDDGDLFGNDDHSFVPITDPLQEVNTDPLNYHPGGYKLGFDACREKILSRLDDPEPIKRGDLKELIRNLKY